MSSYSPSWRTGRRARSCASWPLWSRTLKAQRGAWRFRISRQCGAVECFGSRQAGVAVAVLYLLLLLTTAHLLYCPRWATGQERLALALNPANGCLPAVGSPSARKNSSSSALHDRVHEFVIFMVFWAMVVRRLSVTSCVSKHCIVGHDESTERVGPRYGCGLRALTIAARIDGDGLPHRPSHDERTRRKSCVRGGDEVVLRDRSTRGPRVDGASRRGEGQAW